MVWVSPLDCEGKEIRPKTTISPPPSFCEVKKVLKFRMEFNDGKRFGFYMYSTTLDSGNISTVVRVAVLDESVVDEGGHELVGVARDAHPP